MTARVILDRKARLLRNDLRKLAARQAIPHAGRAFPASRTDPTLSTGNRKPGRFGGPFLKDRP
ncbi:hypothetical protein [Aminobacter sp. AP02]|uniref:hypothetical protein n=1 Tax=Aminobacter sp. AP02 TaxID=2135737 RepID=UPI000D6CA87A|nr:hypothetical protein [Aminobacter sp. AP02]PWK66942.1 hypothetical protein C8K44_11358 [Aminobacter sp. AP02]